MFNLTKYKLLTSVGALLCVSLLFPAFKVYSIYMMANHPEAAHSWQQSDESSTQTVDHQAWQQILDTYLTTDQSTTHLFDYAAVTKEDKQKLDGYIATLEAVDPRAFNQDEQFAFWINLYNALTIKVVLDAYPVDTIRKVGSVINMGPWDDKLLTMQGQSISLNDIEHGILRPIFADNRVHYAVNCASFGCPNLSAQAYTAKNLDEQLDEAATAFINSAKGVNVIEGENKLVLSSIYNWFVVDFGGDREGVFEHLLEYAEGPLEDQLLEFEGQVDYQYDWQLNQP